MRDLAEALETDKKIEEAASWPPPIAKVVFDGVLKFIHST